MKAGDINSISTRSIFDHPKPDPYAWVGHLSKEQSTDSMDPQVASVIIVVFFLVVAFVVIPQSSVYKRFKKYWFGDDGGSGGKPGDEDKKDDEGKQEGRGHSPNEPDSSEGPLSEDSTAGGDSRGSPPQPLTGPEGKQEGRGHSQTSVTPEAKDGVRPGVRSPELTSTNTFDTLDSLIGKQSGELKKYLEEVKQDFDEGKDYITLHNRTDCSMASRVLMRMGYLFDPEGFLGPQAPYAKNGIAKLRDHLISFFRKPEDAKSFFGLIRRTFSSISSEAGLYSTGLLGDKAPEKQFGILEKSLSNGGMMPRRLADFQTDCVVKGNKIAHLLNPQVAEANPRTAAWLESLFRVTTLHTISISNSNNTKMTERRLAKSYEDFYSQFYKSFERFLGASRELDSIAKLSLGLFSGMHDKPIDAPFAFLRSRARYMKERSAVQPELRESLSRFVDTSQELLSLCEGQLSIKDRVLIQNFVMRREDSFRDLRLHFTRDKSYFLEHGAACKKLLTTSASKELTNPNPSSSTNALESVPEGRMTSVNEPTIVESLRSLLAGLAAILKELF